MLDAFYHTHQYLVEHEDEPVRRVLMDEIDWNDRLIAIKGSRGVGKTPFLLAYAKEFFGPTDKRCLYVNFNNFYFTQHTLVEFAEEFVAEGGETLLLDQMFKYEKWSRELRECYDRFTKLHIVFSASPVMRLIEDENEISDVVKMYNLRGFSFREYLNVQAGTHFTPITLDDIITNHEKIARKICAETHPLWYFRDYLQHGYYPFNLKKYDYQDELLKVMNMMLEVDVLLIKEIDVAYLNKIRKLLHIMLMDTPCSLNVSKLSEEIDTSRATIMNYIKYLKDARLLNLLYPEDKQFPMKPSKVYMQNTNLMYTALTRVVEPQAVDETFFYNALHGMHKINATDRNAMFVVDGKYLFNVAERTPQKVGIRMTAVNEVEIGEGKVIPLWLFGFLY